LIAFSCSSLGDNRHQKKSKLPMTTQQRALTTDDIDLVLDEFVVPTHTRFAEIHIQRIATMREHFRRQLEGVKIYPAMIPRLRTELTRAFHTSQVSAGESVGILTAQSIGERQTQLCLNTFHAAGITNATVVHGVPRFKELIGATKHPKCIMTRIHVTERYTNYRDIRMHVTAPLVYVEVRDVVIRMYIADATPKLWYALWCARESMDGSVDDVDQTLQQCPDGGLTILLDTDKIFQHRVTVEHIAMCLRSALPKDALVIPAPFALLRIDVWVPGWTLTDIRKCVRTTGLAGVVGLRNISFVEKDGEWSARVEGCNAWALMRLPWIDRRRTRSNHMWEIYEVLGIEAVREFLIQEFLEVISTDSYLNIRHIQLLVDIMTHTGSISSISRFGVHRNQSGPIAKATFEETLDNFLKAALSGEVESTNGVSASIVCGKPSRAGSGICTLLYDDK
jgi:DNA-directed RNA polymerase beta' subunit